MKHALLVALALLSACASDAETADETAPDAPAATEVRAAPLVQPQVAPAIVAPATDAATPATQPFIRAGTVPQLNPSMGRGGNWVMNTQTDSNKPQPQPWVPSDQDSETITDPTGTDTVKKLR